MRFNGNKAHYQNALLEQHDVTARCINKLLKQSRLSSWYIKERYPGEELVCTRMNACTTFGHLVYKKDIHMEKS